MVNRGWIPKSHRRTYTSENKMTDPVEIVGVIRGTEKRPPLVAKNVPAKGAWHYRYAKDVFHVFHLSFSFFFKQNYLEKH